MSFNSALYLNILEYCILGIIQYCQYFHSPFQQWKVYNCKYLFYIGIYQKKFQNGEIIATKIGAGTENNDSFTANYIEYRETELNIIDLNGNVGSLPGQFVTKPGWVIKLPKTFEEWNKCKIKEQKINYNVLFLPQLIIFFPIAWDYSITP